MSNSENNNKNDLSDIVGKKEKRKISSRQDEDKNTLWFGLGMFGLVGWSVAIPTLIFIAIGILIDSNTETEHSWTLMMLFIGIIIGCINAWYWVKHESEK